MTIHWQDSLPKPIAFVFSAGADSGSVQVGMLKALHEVGLRPDLVVGCSVGALNAAVIAYWGMAQGVESLTAVWPHITQDYIFPGGRFNQIKHLISNRTSIFPNHSLVDLGVRTLPARDFASLAIPFGVLATDLMTYHGTLFTQGDLYQALLASAAIPGVFPPVEINKRLYVDGALTAYVPMTAAIQMGAGSMVVLDAGAACQREAPPSHVADMVLWSLHAALRQRALVEAPAIAQQLPVLYLPSPCSTTRGLFDFSNIEERIEESYQLSKAFLAYSPAPTQGTIVGGPHHHTKQDWPGYVEMATAL